MARAIWMVTTKQRFISYRINHLQVSPFKCNRVCQSIPAFYRHRIPVRTNFPLWYLKISCFADQFTSPDIKYLEDSIKGTRCFLTQSRMCGFQAVQFVGNVERCKNGQPVTVSSTGAFLNFPHTTVNEGSQLPYISVIGPTLQAVRLAEYFNLYFFHGEKTRQFATGKAAGCNAKG